MNWYRKFLCYSMAFLMIGCIHLENATAQLIVDEERASECNHGCLPVWTARAEGLLWWTQGDQLPPLLTTSTAGTPANQAGNLNDPQARILFGNAEVNDSARGGYRFTLGRGVGPGVEVEASYLGLPELTTERHEDSNTQPILSRPFVDAVTGLNDHQAVAFPGSFTGSIDLREESQFQAAGVLMKMEIMDRAGGFCHTRIHFLAGYRFLRLDEDLVIQSSSTVVDAGGVLAQGTELAVRESFSAENRFHGAELGLLAECGYGELAWEFLGRAAVGNSRGIFAIDGSTAITVPGGGAPAVTAGGLLAQPTNIGMFEQDQFAIVPELGVKLRYCACPGLRMTVGYNFIYWSDVLRPGSHIDTTLNLSQAGGGALVGAARPAFVFEDDNFWAQGISFGVDYHF